MTADTESRSSPTLAEYQELRDRVLRLEMQLESAEKERAELERKVLEIGETQRKALYGLAAAVGMAVLKGASVI